MIKIRTIIIITSSLILLLSLYLNYFANFNYNEKFYKFSLKNIEGKEFKLKYVRDKVVLVVNSACECGHTSQLGQLQEIYTKFKARGLEIILLPSDEFNQELETEEEIKEFLKNNYEVGFPVMAKILLTGKDTDPLIKYLTKELPHPKDPNNNKIKWNFEKFLINRNGNLVKRFPSYTKPIDIIEDIEELL